MKTLIFNGSPREKGDTVSLINLLLDGLEGESVVISAYRAGISPCIDCRYCLTQPGCSIKDGMQEVYRYIEECDNIVIASPIYYQELTGQMLNIGSRFQTYFCAEYFRKEKPIKKEKKGAVILVGGGNGKAEKACDTACDLLRHIHCNRIHDLVLSHNTDTLPAAEDAEAVMGVQDIARFFNERQPAMPT